MRVCVCMLVICSWSSLAEWLAGAWSRVTYCRKEIQITHQSPIKLINALFCILLFTITCLALCWFQFRLVIISARNQNSSTISTPRHESNLASCWGCNIHCLFAHCDKVIYETKGAKLTREICLRHRLWHGFRSWNRHSSGQDGSLCISRLFDKTRRTRIEISDERQT